MSLLTVTPHPDPNPGLDPDPDLGPDPDPHHCCPPEPQCVCARSNHNSNAISFHRVKGFRRFANVRVRPPCRTVAYVALTALHNCCDEAGSWRGSIWGIMSVTQVSTKHCIGLNPSSKIPATLQVPRRGVTTMAS